MSIKGTSGSTRATADGAIGPSGKPIRVWNVTWLSGGSAGELVLRNGTSASGTVYVQQNGTASKTATLNFAGGLRFPGGCFFDKDANVTAALVEFEVEA